MPVLPNHEVMFEETEAFKADLRGYLEEELEPVVDESDANGPMDREELVGYLQDLRELGVGFDRRQPHSTSATCRGSPSPARSYPACGRRSTSPSRCRSRRCSSSTPPSRRGPRNSINSSAGSASPVWPSRNPTVARTPPARGRRPTRRATRTSSRGRRRGSATVASRTWRSSSPMTPRSVPRTCSS